MTHEDIEVFVCLNVDCQSRGAATTMANLRQEIAGRGLNHVKPEGIICFAACNVGPNVVIPSKRCWLSGVMPNDAGKVLDYLGGTADIAQFQEKNDPALEKMIFEMIDAGLLEKTET